MYHVQSYVLNDLIIEIQYWYTHELLHILDYISYICYIHTHKIWNMKYAHITMYTSGVALTHAMGPKVAPLLRGRKTTNLTPSPNYSFRFIQHNRLTSQIFNHQKLRRPMLVFGFCDCMSAGYGLPWSGDILCFCLLLNKKVSETLWARRL